MSIYSHQATIENKTEDRKVQQLDLVPMFTVVDADPHVVDIGPGESLVFLVRCDVLTATMKFGKYCRDNSWVEGKELGLVMDQPPIVPGPEPEPQPPVDPLNPEM